ncbi:MAG: 3'(2'),5'-bisphosphate nucleotidase CysQ [Acidimicrobiia bacterium]
MPTDAADALRVANEAARTLQEIRARHERGEIDADEARREGDQLANEVILAALERTHPKDAVLSEEAKDDMTRLEAPRVWIVDPLDGTREFGEPPRTDWAVHVALVEQHQVVAAAVALPGMGLAFSTDPAPPPPPPMPGPPRVVVSRTRPPRLAGSVAEALHGELVEMGSAGAKTLAVVRGVVDIYIHDGGQYEWDSAAPSAIAEAAGCHVSRLNGAPLRYNRRNPWLPDVLVCRPELAERALAAVAAAR